MNRLMVGAAVVAVAIGGIAMVRGTKDDKPEGGKVEVAAAEPHEVDKAALKAKRAAKRERIRQRMEAEAAASAPAPSAPADPSGARLAAAMKTGAASSAPSVVGAVAANRPGAQASTSGKRTLKPSKQRKRLNQISKAVKLEKSQRPEVRKLLVDQRRRTAEAREKANGELSLVQRRNIRRETDQKMKTVLSKEQYSAYVAHKNEKRAARADKGTRNN